MPTFFPPPDFDGPFLKVRRAKCEIERLEGLVADFVHDSDNRVTAAEVNPQTGYRVYRVNRVNRVSAPPPAKWGVSIGEIAHNLRSALDGIVYQLALLKTKTPTGDTVQQFPIFLRGRTSRHQFGSPLPQFEFRRSRTGKTRRNDRPSTGRRMIRDLLPEHQAFIERLQPYKRGNGGRLSPLYWLQEINNMDKHRLIHVVAAVRWGAGPAHGGPAEMRWVKRPMLKYGAKIFETNAMYVTSKVYPLVAFSDRCEAVERRLVTGTVNQIWRTVDGILRDAASTCAVSLE